MTGRRSHGRLSALNGVVHQGNHTLRFWNIVKTQVPTMDRARGWLREHGQILEEEV